MYFHKKVLWVFLIIFILTRFDLSAASPIPSNDDCNNAAESTRPCTRIELLNTLTEEFFNLNRYALRSLKSLFVRVLSDDAIIKAPHTVQLHQHKAQMWRLIDTASLWLQMADAQADVPTNTASGRFAKLEMLVPGLRLMGEFDLLSKVYNTTGVEQPSSQPDVLLIEQLLQKYDLPQLLEELGVLLESFTHNFYKLVEKYLNSLSPLEQADEHKMYEWYELNKQKKFGDFGKFFKLYNEEDVL